MLRRRIIMVTAGITVSSLLVILGIWAHSFSLIPDLFRLNKECQEEGYYMAEFEFKMLGFAYDLDKGQYKQAVSGIRAYHKQLEKRQGLIKLPVFTGKKQEMDFYLNLQNPKTGAFMDDTAPYCTYEGPTGNVLVLLDALSKETGEPVRLKYPLKFFDEINTPEKLTAYLDDLANIGWIAAKLPESSFHMVRDLAGYTRDEDIVNKYHLYSFSPEWKQALLKWFYDNQDPQTGFWGPRLRGNGRLLKLDLHNTGSIVKIFADDRGNDRHALFPLRYKDKMFANTLLVMSEQPPDSSDLDEWHGWRLRTGKGVMLLTRYLWKDASKENKEKARASFESFAKIIFASCYLPDQGAFCYYPGSKNATLDGTGDALGFFERVGAIVPEKQRRLWGGPEETCVDLGCVSDHMISEKDFDALLAQGNVNSVRFYQGSPDSSNYLAGVQGIWYPQGASVLDIMELVPKVRNWINTTSQSMGNWISKEKTLGDLADVHIEPVPVSRGAVPLENLTELLRTQKTLTVVGFDALQIPRYKMVFRLPDGEQRL